jgi:hypothetical protein
VISNDPVIESAAKGEDRGSTFITCDCGEKLTFWAITAQLREQKKPAARILKWVRSFSKV